MRAPQYSGSLGLEEIDNIKMIHGSRPVNRLKSRKITKAYILSKEKLDPNLSWTIKYEKKSLLSCEYRIWPRAKVYRRFDSKTGKFKYMDPQTKYT